MKTLVEIDYNDVCFTPLSKEDEVKVAVARTPPSSLGYRTSNYVQYVQPSNPKDQSDVQKRIQDAIIDTDAYQGRRNANGSLIARYSPYWEKINVLHNIDKSGDHKQERERQGEILFNALVDDGRLSIDSISEMSLDEMRKAAKYLEL